MKRDVREARVEGRQEERRQTAVGMGGVREERRQGGTSRRKAGEEADRDRDGRSA